MPAPFGEEFWALYAEEYVELARQPGVYYPNAVMATRHGVDKKTVGTNVFRMRRDGYLSDFVSRTQPPELTQKSRDILARLRRKKQARVLFTAEIVANSKVEALAEVWDIVQQLEHWDDRTGEPFHYRPARHKS